VDSSIEQSFVSSTSAVSERIALVDSAAAPASSPAQNVRESEMEHVAVLIAVGGSLPRRLWTMLTLRCRIARSQACLRRRGAVNPRAFVAVPDIENPTFLYEFGTPAATYAWRHLRLGHARSGTARSILAAIVGCDPAVGSVLVVGTPR
jgi:hypothetical protein